MWICSSVPDAVRATALLGVRPDWDAPCWTSAGRGRRLSQCPCRRSSKRSAASGRWCCSVCRRRDSDARVEFTRALDLDASLERRADASGPRSSTGWATCARPFRRSRLLLAATPGQASYARATLDRWRREAELHDPIQQVVGDRFTSRSRVPQKRRSRRSPSSLDRAYWRIGSVLGASPHNPSSSFCTPPSSSQDITRAPGWAAGAYDGTIRVPMRGALAKPSELDRVLAHEFTHALVRSLASRGVPAWLNEGLAAALESDEAATEKRDSPAAGQTIPLQALATGFSRMSGAEAELAYTTSAQAARRLIDEAGGAAIVNLLRDLGEGAGFEAAFLHRMQRSFADFQAGGF